MSHCFTGSEADMETCYREVMRDPRNAASYMLVMLAFLYLAMTSDQLSPYNFLIWLALAICLLVALFSVFPCRFSNQLQEEAPLVSAVEGDEETGHVEEQVEVPDFATRAELPDIRIQLASLEREFDDRDYEALRALDADVVLDLPAMTQEQVDALPCYRFGIEPKPTFSNVDNSGRSSEQSESTVPLTENENVSEEIVECDVCLEDMSEGDHIRVLPCSHEFHASCINPWLLREGICPVCKFDITCAQRDTSA